MARRTNRRQIRDKLDSAANAVLRAEGLLAEVVATYHQREYPEGYMVEIMRDTLETTAAQMRDFRATST